MRRLRRRLFHQKNRPAAFDLARDFAVHMRRHSGNAAGQNLAALGHEFLEEIGIFVIYGLGRDIDASTRHRAIGPTKSRTAFGGLRLHRLVI